MDNRKQIVYATTSSFSHALQIAQRNQDRHAYAIPSQYVPSIRTSYKWAVIADSITGEDSV